jgi:hypothetical protein
VENGINQAKTKVCLYLLPNSWVVNIFGGLMVALLDCRPRDQVFQGGRTVYKLMARFKSSSGGIDVLVDNSGPTHTSADGDIGNDTMAFTCALGGFAQADQGSVIFQVNRTIK